MTLFEIVQALQNAPAKGGGKKAVLEANKNSNELAQYLKAVYDPRINYYLKKLPLVEVQGTDSFCADHIGSLISKLAKRQLTGVAAIKYLKAMLVSLDAQGQELVGYIIGRDIKAGVGESTILEYFHELFYIPPYQRCASMSVDLKERFGQMESFFVQSKSDGQFCYLSYLSDGTLSAMSRTGSLYPTWVAVELADMPIGSVAMGELLVHRDGVLLDRKTGNGVLNSVLSGDGSKFLPESDKLEYLVWDFVTEGEFKAGKSDRPYKERWKDIANYTGFKTIGSWEVTSVAEANKIQRQHTSEGKEGTVWKNPEMSWRDCSSGDKDMMKAKTVFEAEFKIVGAYEGSGKYAGMLGGFDMESLDGFIKFSVGSGFNDEQRKALWGQGDDACNGLIATCEGNDIVTSKGKNTESIFLPIFIEIRYDKTEADSRNRVWEQFEAAKLGEANE